MHHYLLQKGKRGGRVRVRGQDHDAGCANSMHCIFNPNARFFSSFQCLDSSACHTPCNRHRHRPFFCPALHMQTFMMTLKNGGRQGRGCGTKVAFVSTVHYGPHACVFVSSAGRIMGCLMKLLVGIITFFYIFPRIPWSQQSIGTPRGCPAE